MNQFPGNQGPGPQYQPQQPFEAQQPFAPPQQFPQQSPQQQPQFPPPPFQGPPFQGPPFQGQPTFPQMAGGRGGPGPGLGRNQIALASAVAVVLLAIGFGVGNLSAKGQAGPAPTVTVTVNGGGQPGSGGQPGAGQGPAPAGPVLYTFSGSGIKNSPQFPVTTATVTAKYTYDCSANYTGKGDFIADLVSGTSSSANSDYQSIANELGAKGGQTTTLYPQNVGAQYHLKVISDCNWSVTLTKG